jgi:hypothetical protein
MKYENMLNSIASFFEITNDGISTMAKPITNDSIKKRKIQYGPRLLQE